MRPSWRTRRVNSNDGGLRLDFDRRLMIQFRGSVVTSDAGLLAYRELDAALGLSTMAGEMLADARTGKNGQHALVGMLRQSVFGRLAGYEDVNDAQRLRHDPAMRWISRRKGGLGLRGIGKPDGALRDQVARGGKEPNRSRRSFRPMDRSRAPWPPSAARYLATTSIRASARRTASRKT